MKLCRAVLLSTLVLGCGAAMPVDSEPSQVDTMDRCSTLPRECIEGFAPSDDDGCDGGETPVGTRVPSVRIAVDHCAM